MPRLQNESVEEGLFEIWKRLGILESQTETGVRGPRLAEVRAEIAPRDHRSNPGSSPYVHPCFTHERVEATFAEGHPTSQR